MGRLGIYSVDDVINYAFLSSRLQTSSLQANVWKIAIFLPWVRLFNVLLVSSEIFVAPKLFLSMMNLLSSIDVIAGKGLF